MADDPTMQVLALDGADNEQDEREIELLLRKHKIPREVVEALRAKHPRMYILRDQPIIFQSLKDGQFERVLSAREKDRPIELKNLASFLVVYPDADAYLRLVQEYTMVWDTIVEAALAFAKGKQSDDAKKL